MRLAEPPVGSVDAVSGGWWIARGSVDVVSSWLTIDPPSDSGGRRERDRRGTRCRCGAGPAESHDVGHGGLRARAWRAFRAAGDPYGARARCARRDGRAGRGTVGVDCGGVRRGGGERAYRPGARVLGKARLRYCRRGRRSVLWRGSAAGPADRPRQRVDRPGVHRVLPELAGRAERQVRSDLECAPVEGVCSDRGVPRSHLDTPAEPRHAVGTQRVPGGPVGTQFRSRQSGFRRHADTREASHQRTASATVSRWSGPAPGSLRKLCALRPPAAVAPWRSTSISGFDRRWGRR